MYFVFVANLNKEVRFVTRFVGVSTQSLEFPNLEGFQYVA